MGVDADVTFTDVGATVEDRGDAAYRDKYRRCAASIIDSIDSLGAAETTLRVVPRQTTDSHSTFSGLDAPSARRRHPAVRPIAPGPVTTPI